MADDKPTGRDEDSWLQEAVHGEKGVKVAPSTSTPINMLEFVPEAPAEPSPPSEDDAQQDQ